jgi:steroid delta-isomerase-like uncharacterized protein
MPGQATLLSPQQLIEAAKAPILAYNEKDWNAVKAAIAPDFTCDEVGTNRKVQGADQVITLWQAWAAAIPDSRATIHSALVSGSTVVLELTWQGTQTGALQTPKGPIAPTGKRIEVRGCQITEIVGEKPKVQRHYFDLTTLLQQIGATG